MRKAGLAVLLALMMASSFLSAQSGVFDWSSIGRVDSPGTNEVASKETVSGDTSVSKAEFAEFDKDTAPPEYQIVEEGSEEGSEEGLEEGFSESSEEGSEEGYEEGTEESSFGNGLGDGLMVVSSAEVRRCQRVLIAAKEEEDIRTGHYAFNIVYQPVGDGSAVTMECPPVTCTMGDLTENLAGGDLVIIPLSSDKLNLASLGIEDDNLLNNGGIYQCRVWLIAERGCDTCTVVDTVLSPTIIYRIEPYGNIGEFARGKSQNGFKGVTSFNVQFEIPKEFYCVGARLIINGREFGTTKCELIGG